MHLLAALRKYIPKGAAIQSQPQQGAKKLPPGHAFKDYEHSDDKEHRTAEQFNWRDQKILAVLTTLFAFGAVTFAYLSFVQARRQADIAKDSLIAQNRAWIDFSFKPETVSLAWTKEGHGNFFINLTVTNRGNSPALNVDVTPAVFLEPFSVNGTHTYVDMTKNALSRCAPDVINWGSALFAGNPIEQALGADFGPEMLAAYIKNRESSFKWKVPDIIIKEPPFRVEVCIVYRVIGDSNIHRTIRTYSLRNTTTNHDVAVGVDIEPGHLLMLSDAEIDYAD